MIDTDFTLYSKETVARLMRENANLLPSYRVNEAKDLAWNKQHLSAVMMDGVLGGSSIRDIAKDLGRVTDMARSVATRTARTAMTSAQNQGRMDAYERAQGLGIKGKLEWIATIDMRTRHTHALMDGEQVDVGEEFSNGCKFPGDPDGEPGEVWNCRCTTAFAADKDTYAGATRIMKTDGMSYDEWKMEHAYGLFSKNVPSYTDNVLGTYATSLAKRMASASVDNAIPGSSGIVEAAAALTDEEFENRAIDYISGSGSVDWCFGEDGVERIKDSLSHTEQVLYRVEDKEFTFYALLNGDLDADGFAFNGEFRSWTRTKRALDGIGEDIEENGADLNDMVVFRLVGGAEHFDMSRYAETYISGGGKDQAESLVGGSFVLEDEIFDNYIKVNGTKMLMVTLTQWKGKL